MPYDPQGVFYGSAEDLEALEAKYNKPDLASRIPGQASTSKPEESRSLRDRAASVLVQANPLMMAKSLQDMTRTLVGGAALPVVAPISAGVQALNALPGNIYRRSRGEEEVKTPSAEELMRKYGEAISPQTPAGQNFQEGVAKLMDTLKVPAAWPVTPNVPRRPLVTPTDVRVGAGQVKQLAKELRETPADFRAAQSGLKRQNLYGEDTIGVKAQAAADALGDTLERRRSAGLSAVPGVPQVLTPDTKMYAVRPKGTRMVQPKVPESAGGYAPEFNVLNDLIDNVYGDTPASKMQPETIMLEYSDRYLPPDSEFRQAFTNYERLKAQEMFPDAPTPQDAQRAYEVLYSDRTEKSKKRLADLEEFLTVVIPEYGQTIPTPSEFMRRMAEAERVIKGPFTTYISKNVGAEGDPTVKLARQGITFEDPAVLAEAAQFANADSLAQKRIEAGFPARGSFYKERLAKTGELDRLNDEIQALEDARRPLFDRAHAEGIDPASIPEYAATTNPLRQKLRQREQLQGELENIRLASDVENISDYAVAPRTKKNLLEAIPFTEKQFFPSVSRAGEDETLYIGGMGRLEELGFKKLGKQLVEDILTGKAGDTSKLTIENYMREKGLSRIEAEKAAKLQEQQYRTALQNSLLERIRNDQNVKTFGNAAIITLDSNTPRDVAMRDMSADTVVLDHCVGQCGTAPQGRKNILTGKQQYYEPVIDPITGERSSRAKDDTSYVKQLEYGHQLVSVRDVKTGLPAATLELIPATDGSSSGKFRIGYASGAKNGAIDPAYVPALRDYLNSRAADIYSPGSNLADNAGIFDSTSPAEFKRAAAEAGLTRDQIKATDWGDLPRFVTVDDIKAAAAQIVEPRALAVQQPAQEVAPVTLSTRDYELMRSDFDTAWDNARESALENSAYRRPEAVASGFDRIVADTFRLHLNDQVAFSEEGVTRLRRVERDLTDRAASAYAQQTDLENEIGSALDDFVIDVRGIRSNIERRLLANEAREREQVQAVAPVNQGAPMPEMSADELLAAHGDRMTQEQRDWLSDFSRRWEDDIANFQENGVTRQPRLEAEYNQWLAQNRLQPDPLANLFDDIEPDDTAAANNPMLQYNPQTRELALQYNIPPVTVREIQARFRDPEVTVANLSMLRDNARAGVQGTIFENLPQEVRDGAARMITEEITRRVPARQQPVEPAAQVAERNPVPRNIQTMAIGNLVNDMSPAWRFQAQELADMYFNDNLIDGNNVTIGALTSMLRDYRVGPHADAPAEVRELAARKLEGLHTEAMQSAEQLADSLNEAFYVDMDPEEAVDQITRDIRMIRENGENAWEDLVGPMAVDFPWNRNVQQHLIRYLQEIANNYGNQREQGYAKGGMVKKKRKAKKARAPMVVTRKSPELAEMQYRYGGIVC